MDFNEMVKRSLQIKQLYADKNKADGHKPWTATDYMSGFVKDMGDLSKLIMVKENLRGIEGDVDTKLAHELGDCFWSLIVIADELNIELEDVFATMVTEVEKRFA